MNAQDGETVNACEYYFSIYECGENIYQSMYARECTALDSIKEVSMNLETKHHDLYLLGRQYT